MARIQPAAGRVCRVAADRAIGNGPVARSQPAAGRVCRVAGDDAAANGRHRIRAPIYPGAVGERTVRDRETGKLTGLVLRAREPNDRTGGAAVDDRRIDDIRVLGVLRTQDDIFIAEVDVLVIGPRMDDYCVGIDNAINRVLNRGEVARPVLIDVILRRLNSQNRREQNDNNRQKRRKLPHSLALQSKSRLQDAWVRWAGELGVRRPNHTRHVPAHQAVHKAKMVSSHKQFTISISPRRPEKSD